MQCVFQLCVNFEAGLQGFRWWFGVWTLMFDNTEQEI